MISEIIAKHPRLVVAIILLPLIISGYYASQMKIGVSTGRFELKNEPYKVYNKILNTFGSEEDNVILVCISKDGYIFHKNDVLGILNLEEKLNESVENMTVQSLVDYMVMGIHILKFQHNLSPSLNVSIDRRIWDDIYKIEDAIANYEYVNSTANDTVRNDTYSIFVLLPKSSGLSFENFSKGFAFDFSFTTILNSSKYNATHYNATNMLIDEIEIYQNLSAYNSVYNSGNESLQINIPPKYSLEFVNKSIEDTEFNITLARIGMEDYNTSFVEWVSYNISFALALSSMYSGYDSIALAIYKGDRSVAENASEYYSVDYNRWYNYSCNLTMYLHGERSTEDMINDTEFMKNKTLGVLRDYLSNYSEELRRYLNGSISWDEAARRTRYTQNVSSLQMNYTSCCREIEEEIIPYLNKVIQALENNTEDYDDAVKLIDIASQNIKDVEKKIMMFYGESIIYRKVLDILLNLKSILLRDETDEIKQAAWNLIRLNFTFGNFTIDVDPFYLALRGYRDTIFTRYEKNTTAIFWDYLSIKNFNVTHDDFENITFNTNYSYRDMIRDVENYTQDDIDEGYEEIKEYDENSTERIVKNYTSTLSDLLWEIEEIKENLSYISKSYEVFAGKDAKNLTIMMNSTIDEMNNYTSYINDGLNASYSLRMIEDFFEARDMLFNTLLSRDSIATVVIISITDPSNETTIYNIVKNYNNRIVEYHTLASKVLIRQIEDTAKHDMATFLPIALIILVFLLFFTYGNLKNTMLSLSAVLIVLIWLFAFATVIGWDFDPITLAVPIMLIGIGIDDGIYVTLRYMEERQNRSRVKSTIITISSVGSALILTTLTSMAGFLSNTVSNMEDIQRFGFLAAIGLLFSFIVMNVYLPAVNMLVDGVKGRKKKNVEMKFAQIGGKIALRNPYIMIIIATMLAVSGVIALTHVSTEFNIKDLAPENSEIIQYYHYYDRNFNATVELSYIYIEGNLTSPEVLKAMANTQQNIENDETVVHDYPVVSPWSIIDKYAHAKRGELYYNETFIKMFEESDINHDGYPDRNITELYRMLEPEIGSVLHGNQAIIIVHTDSHDLKKVNQLYRELSEDANPLRKYVNVKIAGHAIVSKASIDEINENQLRSLTLSVISAITMLIILFRITKGSYVLGVIAALPILMVVTWNWLLMYALGISLNVMTNTIASLCVGLGVDYGIHITHRFVEESSKFYSLRKSLLRATGRIGRGMIGASTTTIASIGILTFSTIPPLSDFALILSFSIFFAFIASLLVLPSMLVLWTRYRRKHGYDEIDEVIKKAIENEDYATLCKYHVSEDYCLLYVLNLMKKGKIAEARKVIQNLKEEGINLENLLRSQKEDLRFE